MAWYQVLMIISAVFGMNSAMFYFLSNRIDRLGDRMNDIIKEIRDSNLDFHGRLSKLEGKGER